MKALQTAPCSICLRASSAEREQAFEPGAMLFIAGAGCPNATDLERGRRPGSLRDYEETLKLQQSFDVIHMFGPSAEPQDVPVWFHHYAMMRAQSVHDDKPMFAYARGRRQVAESFEPVRLGLELSEEEFSKGSWVTTITNSRRQIDIPMAEGVIDFARAGRVITPFCLAGARRLWRVRLQCRYEVWFARIRNTRACQNDDRVRTTRPPYRPALATGGRRCVEHGRHAGGLRNAYGSVGGNVGQRHAYRICGGLGRKAD